MSSKHCTTAGDVAPRRNKFADRHPAYKPADDLFVARKLRAIEYLAYRLLLQTTKRRSYSDLTNEKLAKKLKCKADFVTVVYRRLKKFGLIWRERIGNSWRTYIAYFQPAPAEAPAAADQPAEAPAAADQPAEAPAAAPAIVDLVCPACGVHQPAIVAEAEPGQQGQDQPSTRRAFFVASAPDQRNGSTRSADRVSPFKDSDPSLRSGSVNSASGNSSLRSELPPAIGGGAKNPRSGAADTPAITLLKRIGVRAPVVFQLFADRLADVQLAIDVGRSDPGVQDLAAFVVRLLLDGIWPSRLKRFKAGPFSSGSAALWSPENESAGQYYLTANFCGCGRATGGGQCADCAMAALPAWLTGGAS